MDKERIGKSIYGILCVAVLVTTFYRYDPNDDWGDVVFMQMVAAMGLLTFPIGFIGVPLGLAISFIITLGFSWLLFIVLGEPSEASFLTELPMRLFVLIVWLVTFVVGYMQWFSLLPKFDKWQGTSTKKSN